MADYAHTTETDDRFAERVMAEHGVPQEVRFALRAVSLAFRGWGAAGTVTRELHDGGVLELRDRTLRVHHRPGHSPSDTVLHDAERGLLLGADHLIKHISSNPLVSRPLDGDADTPRPQALVTYLASLRETQAMDDVALVLPGHGNPIDDHVALIDERFRLHLRRAEKILKLLGEGPRTAYEVAQAMWGNIAVTQAYLTLSEVLGHVDLLLADGRAVEVESDGIVRFHAAA
jgi:glyoxylase-like metal-dependent hydrolase (beta-lactamase superfamily II)